MNRRLDLLAIAVIFGGITSFTGPRPAHATYLDPWREERKAAEGVAYCCRTGNTARCCSHTGCMTRDGVCIVMR